MKEYKIVIAEYETSLEPIGKNDDDTPFNDNESMKNPDKQKEVRKRIGSSELGAYSSYLKAKKEAGIKKKSFVCPKNVVKEIEIEEYLDGELIAVEPVEDDLIYRIHLVKMDEQHEKIKHHLNTFCDEIKAVRHAKEEAEKIKENQRTWIEIHGYGPNGNVKYVQIIRAEEDILVDFVTDDMKPQEQDSSIFNANAAKYKRQQQAAINGYKWLIENGIMQKAAFQFARIENPEKPNKSYYDFAVDVKELLPYRKQIEENGLDDMDVFTYRLFDAYWSKCHYSGAFQLIYPMKTYRSNCGCVGSSWEIDMIEKMKNRTISEVANIRHEKGVMEAIKETYKKYYGEEKYHEYFKNVYFAALR